MLSLAAVAIMLIATEPVAAEKYPDKPIHIIVPLAPGGTDALVRVIAVKLQERFGQSVIVENRSGAGGNIGAEAVARSRPDGYTLMFTQPGPLVVNKACTASWVVSQSNSCQSR